MNQENDLIQTKTIPNQLKGIYAYNAGKKLSEEHKEAISNSLKGNQNPNYGKPLSDDHKKNISESLKGSNNPKAILSKYKILDTFTNEYFIGTPYEIKNKFNLDRRNVHVMINNKSKSYKQWICLGIVEE
jgi:hypothetical protein